MVSSSIPGVTLSISVLHLLQLVICGPTRDAPIRTTATFYDSADLKGRKLSYREEPVKWSNLAQLFESANFLPTAICVSGAWLVYGRSSFRSIQDDEVKVISGADNCIFPPDILGIMSMQPITPPSFSPAGSIALFPQINFGSLGQLISAEEAKEAVVRQLEGRLESIGSIIVVGEIPWSLISSSGKIMCVRPMPKSDITSPICYGRDLLSIQVADFHVDAVYPDCPDEQDPSIAAYVNLRECKNFGSDEVESLKSHTILGRGAENSEGIVAFECPQNNGGSNDTATLSAEERKLLEKMIRLRLKHDFASATQTLWPEREEDIWKTIPLDTAFDVVMATVPESIVSIPFLRRIREFTVFHLNEVWKAGSSNDTSGTKDSLYRWRNHRVIVYMLQQCLQVVSSNAVRYQMTTDSEYKQIGSMEDFNDKILPDFVMNMDFDPVIETAYVVANYAMALCHSALQYNLNFWDNFVTTFHSMYFKPLEERWKNPTQLSPKSFRVVFAGFGTASQYKRLAFATTYMFALTPNLQPFEKFYVGSK